MSWKNWFDPYITDAELSTGAYSQSVKPNSNKLIRYARTQVIIYNDAPFTTLQMKIYSKLDSGARGALLASSDTRTKAEIITLENGVKEVYFEFNDFPMHTTNEYLFVLTGAASGMSDNTFIGWKKGYPDPVYTTNVSSTFHSAAKMPYYLYFIGAEL